MKCQWQISTAYSGNSGVITTRTGYGNRATRLAQTTVQWHYTEGDARYDGIAALFGAEISRTARKTGTLRFNFPPLLVPILKDPRRFARLRTHFLIELSGKYAVTLYELLESNVNKDVPELRARVDESAAMAQSA